MESAGLKLNLFTSGSLKGAGFGGAALTAAQSEHLAAQVSAIAGQFFSAVKNRRTIAAEVAQGASYFGFQSTPLGLIDGVVSDFSAFLAATSGATKPRAFQASVPEPEVVIGRAVFEALNPRQQSNFVHNGGRVIDGDVVTDGHKNPLPQFEAATLGRDRFFSLTPTKQREFVRAGGLVNS